MFQNKRWLTHHLHMQNNHIVQFLTDNISLFFLVCTRLHIMQSTQLPPEHHFIHAKPSRMVFTHLRTKTRPSLHNLLHPTPPLLSNATPIHDDPLSTVCSITPTKGITFWWKLLVLKQLNEQRDADRPSLTPSICCCWNQDGHWNQLKTEEDSRLVLTQPLSFTGIKTGLESIGPTSRLKTQESLPVLGDLEST